MLSLRRPFPGHDRRTAYIWDFREFLLFNRFPVMGQEFVLS